MNDKFEEMNLDELRAEHDELKNWTRNNDRKQFKSVQSGYDNFSRVKLDHLKDMLPVEAAEICSRLPDVSDQASALRNVLRGWTVEWSLRKAIASKIESQIARDKNRKVSAANCDVQIGRWSTNVAPDEAENIRCSVAKAISQDCNTITGRAITSKDIQMEVDASRPSSYSSVATREGEQIGIDFGGLKETVSIPEATQIWSTLNSQFRPNG
jgi:hypothetical protein